MGVSGIVGPMEGRIREIVQKALTEAGAPELSFAVEWPTDSRHGDYAVNAALAAAKALGQSPREVGEMLAEALRKGLGEDAAVVDVAGPGFVNVKASQSAIDQMLIEAISPEWGKGESNSGKRVIIEYSCPNPFKEMHIGHLMSTVIGESFSRLIENSGAHVVRDTYGGDVGPHIAKALWALQKEGVSEPQSATELGEAYARGARAYEESEEAKAEIDALNQEIYKGEDTELMALWNRGREVSLESFREVYKVLGTHFDYYFFESETAPIGMEVVKDGLQKGVFEESEGAVIYRGEKKGLHTLVFITSRGTPTYETKDIGLAFLKEQKVETDQSFIVTAAEQIGHFNVFLAALRDIAPLVAEKTKHIPHGFLRLVEGKMSSREGTIISAESLVNDVIAKAKEKNEDPVIAEQVAVGALKYMILRQAPGSDIIFDFDRSLSLEGDSGPYLQYAYVRATSVLSAAGKEGSFAEPPPAPYLLARMLTRFAGVALRAEEERAPQYIATYLTELASEWNSFYAKERIVGGEFEEYKLALASAFANTMRRGLWLLGIPAPERM